MKIMKRIFLIVAILLFIYSDAFSQNILTEGNEYHVISTTGLNVRSGPSLNAKKIGALPFNATVTLIEKKEINRDTLGEAGIWYHENSNLNKIALSGYWVKVKTKELTGYVFSSYLFEKWNRPSLFANQGINEDHIILFPSQGCFDNFRYNSNLNWFGVYVVDNQDIIKPVKPSFFNIENQMAGFCITAHKPENLRLIYGTKADLSTVSAGSSQMLNGFYSSNFDDYPEFNLKGEKLYLKRNGKVQLLNEQFGFAYSIFWKGDIDNDGKQDYILHFGEKAGYTVLFISSEASENEIVKPVSIFFSGYCC